MKKSIFLIFALFSMASAQSCMERRVINREVDTKEYGKMLLGEQSKSQLSTAPYKDWYDRGYGDYKTDPATLAALKKEKLASYNLVLFLGTWCSDSKRDVPRLMKILDEIKYPESKLQIIAVNRKKESPNGEEVKYNVKLVPTIIVERYGKEVGRITEHAKTGAIEKDLLEIISK